MDLRAYANVEVEAETPEQALASITPELVVERAAINSLPDDISFNTPREINVLEGCECDQGHDHRTDTRDIENGDWVETYFVITGRIPFDDEDSAKGFWAANEQEATDNFVKWIVDKNPGNPRLYESDPDTPEVIINLVMQSSSAISISGE